MVDQSLIILLPREAMIFEMAVQYTYYSSRSEHIKDSGALRLGGLVLMPDCLWPDSMPR